MSCPRLRSAERRLCRAVRIAMLGMVLAGTAGSGTFAYAAGASLDATVSQTYNIPAGPLGRNLSTFAAQSGVALSFDPALTAGLNSPSLHGSFSPRAAITHLLADSGLEIAARADGSYTVTKKSTTDVPRESAVLPVVQVTSGLGSTTENTGSYTTGAASTATRLNMSLRETPQSVSVMTRQRMEDQGLTQLSDVVVQTAGLTMGGGGNVGSDSSPIYARGFQVDNYQIDGVSHLYSNYGSIFQSNDMALYDRVEVVRGATGLMSGIGLPGATINLIRKRPTRDFQASARAEAGSWNYYRAEADVSTPMNEAGTLRGRLVTAYQQNDSYIDRLEEKKKIVSGVVEAELAPHTLATFGFTYQNQSASGHARAGLSKFFSDGSLTNWSRSKSAAASWATSDRENQTLFAALEHQFDNEWLVKGTYTHSRSKYDEILGYASSYGDFPNKATGAGIKLWASRWAGEPVQNSFDLYATGPFTLFGRKHELVVGVTSIYTKDDTVGYNGWLQPAVSNIYEWDGNTPAMPAFSTVSDIVMREQTNSAYTTARFKPTDALSLILGARYTSWKTDKRTDYYNPATTDAVDQRSEQKVIPYAGLVYDINDNWSTYVSYTDIFKPQSARDITNNVIDPLQGKSYEAGVKGEFFDKRLNVGAAVYKVEQDNLAVTIQPTIALPNGGGNAVEAVSGTTTKGFELEVGGEIARNWQGSASFARNLSRDRNGMLLNTNIPQNTFKLFTTYRIASIGNGLIVGGGVRWQGDTYSQKQGPNSARLTQKAYAVVDTMARYNIAKNLSATVNLFNVFDKSYYLTSDTNSYYGAPRNIRVALDMRF
ncbi:MAG: TonB-dependent siderophore receptor [Oxalicibacterium faecigallinarum]|uniref:TonB-dependent siderophore receptor n=1 Tax=Oxalicibacterium faecigallinarum TaxID=573741 RepID=UPI002806B0A4|nr:TonB-dependent siderophore receptor [Oxalicibacterium faecigallinarum]MDQ7970266.1 TonB-dependent siderophore receptor [Oxalicibacterium faecigallinarum]